MPRKKRTMSTVSVDSRGNTMVIEDGPAEETDEQRGTREFDEFMEELRERYKECADNPSEIRNRSKALEDLKFKLGDQWPADVMNRRVMQRKPVITINRVKPACRLIANEQRQNRGSIHVYPVDDKADTRTAEILQGLIRHVETNSMADIAYDTASDGQVTHGLGYIRVTTGFATPLSMDQEIYIKSVKDPFAVYYGPYREMDASDADYAFIVEDLTSTEYEHQFPKKVPQSALNDFGAIGNASPNRIGVQTYRIAEYFYRVHRETTIVQFDDGSVMEKDFIPPEIADVLQIVAERQTKIPQVHWCLTNGYEKLDEREWAGMYIPIIPVIGEENIVDGQLERSGVVRDAKDPQRQYNYFRANMTETVSLAPKAPYVMAEGQDEGHEEEWRTANLDSFSSLKYKPTTVGGQLVPAPQRNLSEPPIQALVIAAQQYEDDIKATTMVYDPQLGARSNETSGRAISLRQQQGTTANYNYADNLSRALRHVGRLLLDLFPRIYDARQIARIIGEDDKSSRVHVTADPRQPAYQEQPTDDGGIQKIYNLSVGQYDVVVGVGNSYMTKRQEAFDMLTKLVNSWPELMQVAGDIIIANSDIPGAEELRDRLKKALPPQLQDDKEDGQEQLPPRAKMQIQQMLQQMQIMTQQLNEAKEVIRTKQVEADNQMRLQIQKDRTTKDIAAVDAEVKMTDIATKAQMDNVANQLAALQTMIDSLHRAEETRVKEKQVDKPKPVSSN